MTHRQRDGKREIKKRQTEIHIERHVEKQTEKQTYRHMDRLRSKQAYGHTDSDRQSDSETEKIEIKRQTD